jgi:MoaA/NifB/PqqE/SkfB family radical SAM enzyme
MDEELIEISNDYPNTMHIEWVVSNVCNYKCSYCDPSLNNGSSRWPDYEKSLEFFNTVHKEINGNCKLLSLTGGEPTLWPDLFKFLNNLDRSYYSAIVTNGSRSIKWWKKFIQECKNLTRVTISVHLHYSNSSHIIEVCKLLHKYCQVTVLVIFDLKYKQKCFEFINEIEKHNLEISITLKPVIKKSHDRSVIDYSLEEKEKIKNYRYSKIKIPNIPVAAHLKINGKDQHVFYANKLISEKKNKFKGWFCEAGSKRLIIWYDGTIYGSQCPTAKKYPLGNINQGLIKTINGMVCDTEFCDCLPDIRIPKRKNYDK